MERLRVGLDADGVIFDGAEMKSRMTYELFGVYIDPQEFCKRLVFQSGRVSREQYEEMKRIAYNTEVALTFKFVPGAERTIRHMINLDWFLPVLTNRKDSACDFIRRILDRVRLPINVYSNGQAVLSENGHYKDNTKLDLINQLGGLDVYIDDDLSKLESLAGYVPNLILFSQPFNQDEDAESIGAVRLDGWGNVLDYCLSLTTADLVRT